MNKVFKNADEAVFDVENNNTITKKQYQPETIREETIVEITEANDIVVPSPPKMQSGFTKRNNNNLTKGYPQWTFKGLWIID